MSRLRLPLFTLRAALASLLVLIAATMLGGPAAAHPLPVSSVDITYRADRIDGRVVIHMRDLAGELGIGSTGTTLDPTSFVARATAIDELLTPRLMIGGSAPQWRTIRASPGDADALELTFVIPGKPPPELPIRAALVPSDRDHQTFVNVYEGGTLRQQWLLGAASEPVTYYAGSNAGLLAAAGSFMRSGVHHILIGPDHVLFVIGLILLGGTLRRLVTIVTAFTIGHSVTLSLAATGVVMLPEWFIEPAIALSIVVVGVDNLMRGEGRDIRPLLAFAFGLVHGFGFAYVLRAFGLPEAHRAVALVSFNLGVELGQIAIVLIVGTVLALIRRRSETAGKRVAMAGSLAVAAAGGYWFVDRVFFGGATG